MKYPKVKSEGLIFLVCKANFDHTANVEQITGTLKDISTGQ
jgi:hypothetical protein